jgi:hypothetical protein
MRPTRFTEFLLIALVVIALAGLAGTSAFAQSCNANCTAPVERGGWASGTTVNYYINTSNMSPQAQQLSCKLIDIPKSEAYRYA